MDRFSMSVRQMSEWEYTTINLSELPVRILTVDVLNNAGGEGWELIAITANHVAYLKRQIARPGARVRRSSPSSGPTPGRTPGAPPDATS
jgi:hypothetical protein